LLAIKLIHGKFFYLIIPEANENDVGLVDPDLFAKLTTDVAKTLDAIEAHGFDASIAQHFDDLGILLAVFAEHQFTLEAFVFVLTATAVLSSLSLIFGHIVSLF